MSRSKRYHFEKPKRRPSGAKECRHILPSGARCHALALRGTALCYFHTRHKAPANENQGQEKTFAPPFIEDRASIQIAINEVLAALAAGKIKPRQASLNLYALQLSIQNLSHLPELACRDSVFNPSHQKNGELLAPKEDEEDDDMDMGIAERWANEPVWKGRTPEVARPVTWCAPILATKPAAPGLTSESAALPSSEFSSANSTNSE